MIVEVYAENMKKYIKELSDLYEKLSQKQEEVEIDDLGNAPEALETVENNYIALTEALAGIVNVVHGLMENSLDGYIDVDEAGADMLDKLIEDMK